MSYCSRGGIDEPSAQLAPCRDWSVEGVTSDHDRRFKSCREHQITQAVTKHYAEVVQCSSLWTRRVLAQSPDTGLVAVLAGLLAALINYGRTLNVKYSEMPVQALPSAPICSRGGIGEL
jgi:hypothetical protein